MRSFIGVDVMRPDVHIFCVADFYLRIVFESVDAGSVLLLPSFAPFAAGNDIADDKLLLFSMTVKSCMKLSSTGRLLGCTDTGNGSVTIYELPDGGHEYVVRNIHGDSCCLLKANKNFAVCCCALKGDRSARMFGLNNALMLAFAFAGCFHDAVLIHASCVMHGGKAYPFVAASGTGKSTHANLWMRNIEDVQLLNDDNPVIRIIDDGTVMVYGTPWSGKTPCYRRRRYPLGAVTRIVRAADNSIVRRDAIRAFATLLPACSSMKWDEGLHGMLCHILSRIIEHTSIYTMYCLPNNEAALICHKEITKSC